MTNQTKKPNFIIFLTDDQGYGDLSCMGATDFKTPNLDKMAEGGARFTSWYSNSPVCSPSRASLLTGRYPLHAGVNTILAGHRTATGLPPEVPTIAKVLKENDYQTFMSGKWHLGVTPECQPSGHGFEKWFGHLAGCIDYYSHIFYWGMNNPGPGVNPTHDCWEDGKELWDFNGEYFTDLIAEKAIAYIEEANQSDKPFFLYVPFNAPHYPMHAPKEYMDRFADLPWDRQVMAAMLSAMDDAVGKIMDKVNELGMAEDTCSIFTSDNGPSRESRNWLDGNLDPYYGGSAGKLKGHKFSLYEGGIRMPGILHYPGTVEGGQVIDAPVASMDMFPTFLTMAGIDPSAYDIDGQDIGALLQGDEADPRTICWEIGDQLAIREGDMKLVIRGRLVEHEKPPVEVHLSNIKDDMAESKNLADEQPELVARLRDEVETWHNKHNKAFNKGEFGKGWGLVTH